KLHFDGAGHRIRHHLRVRTRIVGFDLHHRRGNFRKLGDRQSLHRREAHHHDDDGQDRREDRTVDEKVGDHRPPFTLVSIGVPPEAAPVSAAGTGFTGAPGAILWRPSTTTRSPARSPSSMSHWLPCQLVAWTLRTSTLSPSPTTSTTEPLGPCCTARCGTRMAPVLVYPLTRILTNCPGSMTRS